MTNEEAKMAILTYCVEECWLIWHCDVMNKGNCVQAVAIKALENIDRITAERDALMHELQVLSSCTTCIKHCDCNRTDIVTGSEKKCWEWRGGAG